MKKPLSEQIIRFILFALPSFWLLAVLFIALVIWKVGLNEPDLPPVALVCVAILVAAVFLTRNQVWVCAPMVVLGLSPFFIPGSDQHVGHITALYGAYLALHYSACLVVPLFGILKKNSGKHSGDSAHGEDKTLVAILCITIIFACSLLLVGCSNNQSKEEEEVLWDAKPSVMIDGVLYGTTGRTGIYSTDTTPENGGHVDGEITSTVESHEYPTEDDQSNFGTGYYYRYGEKHTVEIFFDSSNKWVIYEPYLDEQQTASRSTGKEAETISTESDSLEPISSDMFGQDLYDALQKDWASYDALSAEHKMLSSHIPGNCKQDFDNWDDCETFIGFPVFNPLEDHSGLEKGTYVGMPIGFMDAPHIQASWYGTKDGHVEWVSIQSGYRHKEIRIVVDAKLYGDPAEDKPTDKGWSTELDRQWYLANVDSNSPIITEDSTEKYVANTAYLAQGQVLYSIRVIGELAVQNEVQAILKEILPCFDKEA